MLADEIGIFLLGIFDRAQELADCGELRCSLRQPVRAAHDGFEIGEDRCGVDRLFPVLPLRAEMLGELDGCLPLLLQVLDTGQQRRQLDP